MSGRNEKDASGWSTARVLRFPGTRSVGNVWALYGYGESMETEFISYAQHEVAIPAGMRVKLELDDAGLDVWNAIAEFAPGDIQGLDARGSGANESQLPETLHLAHFTELEQLTLRDANVALEVVARLTSLVGLALIGCRVVDDGAGSELAELEQLEELGVIDTPLDWRGFTPPRGLRVFEAPDADLDDDVAQGLERCTDLEHLYLSGSVISQWRFLEELPMLSVLNLANVALDDDDFELHESCSLRFADLSGTAITSASVQALLNQAELSSLGLESTNVDDAGIDAIANGLPQLSSLRITGTLATPGCLPSFAKLTELGSLDLAGLGATAPQLACLDHLELLALDLSENPCAHSGDVAT